MPQRVLEDLVEDLGRFCEDGADWRPLASVLPALRERAAWLESQLGDLPAPLVVILVGGTGVGKSMLLNALAGHPIARCGEDRPTTEAPTIYLGHGLAHDFGPAQYVESPALDALVLIDTPDTDSVKTVHAERVAVLLRRADVVLLCATQEKYKNERTLELLRPLRDERKIVAVQTHADRERDIRADWLEDLRRDGFAIDRAYRVSAKTAIERAEAGGPAEDGIEFAQLDRYVKEKLPADRLRIKERNLEGTLRKTLDTLHDRLDARAADLETLDARLSEIEREVGAVGIEEIHRRLLDAPHVWIAALADAVSERAFGVVGNLYRLLHWIRTIPSRFFGALSPASLLRLAAPRPARLDSRPRGNDGGEDAFLREIAGKFGAQHAAGNACLVRAGFSAVPFDAWRDAFAAELRGHIVEYLEPAQRRIQSSGRNLARVLVLLEVLWFVPFVLTVAQPIVTHYVSLFRNWGSMPAAAVFDIERTLALFAAVIAIELVAFAFLVRQRGRWLRRKCGRDLARTLGNAGFGFAHTHARIREIGRRLADFEALRTTVGQRL